MPPNSLSLAKTVSLTFQTFYATELSGLYSHNTHIKQLGPEGIEKISILYTSVQCFYIQTFTLQQDKDN